MKFIQFKDLKEGMRIAKPVYNQKGVLLFSRGSELQKSALNNIQSLNLFGLYILEPTEPLPPMSPEELEFERFQLVSGYTLAEELQNVINKNFSHNLETLATEIQQRFGKGGKKINFIQAIRNPDDHVYKHSINVAILAALISGQLSLERHEQLHLIIAALLHDIGKLLAPAELLNKTSALSAEELSIVRKAELEGYSIVRENYLIPAGIRRFFVQMHAELSNKMAHIDASDQKLLLGTKIIKIADLYDILTAMRIYKEPMSEFSAISYMLDREYEFDENLVDAIIKSINILPVGACVELTNGEKGLVLSENDYYALRPRVLSFKDNTVYDLGQRKTYEQVRIKDILKTMDNRFVFSENANMK